MTPSAPIAAGPGAGATPRINWHAYVLAIATTAAALLLRFALKEWIDDRPVLILFVLPVIICAYQGGLWPGLVCTGLIAVGTNYYLMPPAHSLAIDRPVDLAQWMLLVLIGILVSVLSEALVRSRDTALSDTESVDHLHTERKIQGGFIFALVCLVVIGGVSYLNIARLHENMRWVEHTRDVIVNLESLYSKMTDAQNGRRGYVLTDESAYLQPYVAATRTIDADLKYLRELVQDNPEQVRRVESLAQIAYEQLAFDRDVINELKERGSEPARRMTLTGRGKALHDQMRAAVDDMKGEEESLLRQRQEQTLRSADLAKQIIVTGSILAFGIVGIAMLLISRDLQRRVRAEAERDRFFTLSQDMLCVMSSDGYFKRVSPSVHTVLGWTPEEFLSRPFIDMVHPDDQQVTQQEVDRQVHTGASIMQFENRYLHKDGSWRTLSWASVPQPGGLMYAAARDVTERHEAEIEIAKLNVDLQARAIALEEANRELESFSYSVSHDLRAPLRHVQGYVQMLTRELEGTLSDSAIRYLGVIAKASRDMGQLIDDLLSFSRMGRAELRETIIEPNRVIADVRHGLELATQGRDIRWKISEIPAVRGDLSMIKQVFANLLGNAVKYSRNREIAEIEIGCAGQENDQIVIFVRDNGAGFDMQYVDKLFGVFQRLHRIDEFEGTGIGLANVRRIISRHGGRTWAEGAVDHGATIYFTLKPAESQAS